MARLRIATTSREVDARHERWARERAVLHARLARMADAGDAVGFIPAAWRMPAAEFDAALASVARERMARIDPAVDDRLPLPGRSRP